MSTFGCVQKTVTTRKTHDCDICGRTIPKGFNAAHTSGMWEGDWQNWYACEFCKDNCIPNSEEGISNQDFTDYVFEMPEANCPRCTASYGDIDFEIEQDSDTIAFSCERCGHKWTHEIYGVTRQREEGK